MNEVENNPGETLKSSRERLGLSINDVSVATKISPRILKALEAGQREQLPPKSFTRGFIRSYAAYLKIDAKPILDAYQLDEVPAPLAATNGQKATQDTTTPDPVVVTPMPSPTSPGDKDSQTRKAFAGTNALSASKAFLVGGLLILIGVVVGIKQIVEKYEQERLIEPAAVESAVKDAQAEPAAEGTAALATTNPDATVAPTEKTPEEKSATAPAAATEPQNESTTEPAATPAVTATPKTEPAKVETPKAEPVKTEAAKVEPTKTEPVKTEPAKTESAKTEPVKAEAKPAAVAASKPANPQEVIIEAMDKVEITIKVDGESSKKIKLSPDSVHTIKAKSNVEIEVSDGGLVNVIHNGREQELASELGKPLKLKYP